MTLPVIIKVDMLQGSDFICYYKENEQEIEKELLKYGALKFQNVMINSYDDFQRIVNSISKKFLNYVNGNSPRIKLSGNVYTSTEYDKTKTITMHNEMSYSSSWPNRLFLSCMVPPETGGETLLADSREILKAMNPDIVDEVKSKGIIYIRNLHGGSGLGPSWQETYETDNKKEVEAYFKSVNIDFSWDNEAALRISQFRQGTHRHRITGEECWFNQIDHFHPCHLNEEYYKALSSMYDNPLDFPMYVQFGDGSEISVDMVKEILQTIESLTLAPKWAKNELLILDNETVCHGRSPYTGDRLVVVSMTE